MEKKVTDTATQQENLTPEQIWDQELLAREQATSDNDAALPEQKQEEQVNQEVKQEEQVNTNPPEKKDDTGNDKPDPYALILEKLEKLEGRQRNVEGHIGGLKTAQNKLHEAMESARELAKKASEAPTQSQVAEASKNPEEWETLKKDFPEWADATEKLLGSRLAGLQAPKGALSEADIEKLVEDRIKKAEPGIRQEIVNSTLEAVLPDWQNEVKKEQFTKWMNAQEPDVKALASSAEVKDAARMLRLYSEAMKSDQSKAIQEDRQQKLAQATALPKGRTAAPTKTVDQMTPQELWDYEAKKREQERAKRGY
jgi:hypothetical protein